MRLSLEVLEVRELLSLFPALFADPLEQSFELLANVRSTSQQDVLPIISHSGELAAMGQQLARNGQGGPELLGQKPTTDVADQLFVVLNSQTNGGDLYNPEVVNPTIQATTGWLTMGQAFPQGFSTTSVQIGPYPTQVDVKKRWPDNSIKFAVLTTYIGMAGEFQIVPAAPFTGALAGTVPNVRTSFNIGASNYQADIAVSTDLWLNGPLVREQRYVSTPKLAPGFTTPHPCLQVIYDTRVYSDGSTRLDVTVENTLAVAEGVAVTYSVDIWHNAGGTEVLLFHHDPILHGRFSRWRKVFNLDGSAPGSRTWSPAQVIHDFEPFYESKALPRFWNQVANWTDGVDPATTDILGVGKLEPYMPNSGGRAELAPYPDWTVRYVVHQVPEQKNLVLLHGDLAGSWPVHAKQASGQLYTIDTQPNVFWDVPQWREGDPPGQVIGHTPGCQPNGCVPDNNHQPSLAHVPYLVTGDRYYSDEQAYWANYVLLGSYQDEYGYYNNRGGGPGSGHNGSWGNIAYWGGNETRGVGWGIRTMVDVAAWGTPDGHPVIPYLIEKTAHTVEWLDYFSNTFLGTQGPLGAAWHYGVGWAYDDPGLVYGWTNHWMQEIISWAVDRGQKLGVIGATAGNPMITQTTDFQIRFTNNPETQAKSAPYQLPLAYQVPPGSYNFQWFTDLDEIGNVIGNSWFPDFGPNARLVTNIGVERSMLGASAASTYINARTMSDLVCGYPTVWSALQCTAGWALMN